MQNTIQNYSAHKENLNLYGRKQSTGTNNVMTQMLKVTDKDF